MMELNSQQVCSQCKNLEECVKTAVLSSELVIKCVHFGYVKKVSDNYMARVEDEIIKIRNELIGIEED